MFVWLGNIGLVDRFGRFCVVCFDMCVWLGKICLVDKFSRFGMVTCDTFVSV